MKNYFRRIGLGMCACLLLATQSSGVGADESRAGALVEFSQLFELGRILLFGMVSEDTHAHFFSTAA